MPDKRRLITRDDLDGVVCAVLLKSIGAVDEVAFAHPKDMQDGKIAVTDQDISANLPYVPGIHQAFDHHASEATRVGGATNLILDVAKPSAARLIYEHFGGKTAFPKISDEMMVAVDMADAAQYTEFTQIFEPERWTLLSFILDPRTGLSSRTFRTSHETFLRNLIESCITTPIEQILELPDVHERVERYFDEEAKAKEQIKRRAKVHQNLVVVDFRGESQIHAINRFVIYTLYPKQNISLTVAESAPRGTIVFAAGKSVVNLGSKTNVGELMLEFGGGGHAAAGTCRVPSEQADEVLRRLVERITRDG